jgi:hypothetical protein
VRYGKKSIIISFALGFLSCTAVIYVWQAVRKEESTMRDDILNGRLKIKLASKLKEDKKASEELVELLRECRQHTYAVESMEEDVRGNNDAFSHWEKKYIETYLESLENIARFAIDHRETKAALTAKLVYTFLEPFTVGYGPMTEQYLKMWANSTLFLQEIVNQHPKTWQASITLCHLATHTPGDEEEHHREKIRLLKSYLKKELAEPPENDPAMEILAEWYGPYEGPLKAGMLEAIADSQYNLGTLGGRRDLFWLHKAKKTYQELIRQYPEYNERNGWAKNHIKDIDKKLTAEPETKE